ncbi:methyltransferase domain-containing protein [Aeromicrobium sp. 636]|uniref:Class I SAM-dependent methyltransferase n=2 Tax=Nocardioidaceae TaxID=85015 RepID=A0A8I0JYY6_9ACTN|nr:class I SAM-dependent methyltransferase [Aeromicrobium senzhongii]MBC9224721.1 class I SAM-dependent methyltransferase [Aeromicrobium senzhongii]MCQ3996834.1 methyltransferase domain-containing protein [Aeromicrobium sp. 636]MTB86766.1 methyltransferase domain-containing protein [Aeromicrobium senzhongii]QNL95963.1 class I SAM-dependent methyltransferase [Aeromicrobium senzhongii]
MDPAEADEVFAHWERTYSSRDGVWSGHVNVALARVAADLTPGTALDLGAGEGGDALWLAERGWDVTGIDISPTALARAEVAAERAGLSERVTWVAADLDTWSSPRRFDLVTASFLQSPVRLDRARILRSAAGRVAEGGHLLVIAHAEAPPWAHDHEHEHAPVDAADFPSPADDLQMLDLPADSWRTVIAEVRDRRAFAPNGDEVVLRDSVLLLQRT